MIVLEKLCVTRVPFEGLLVCASVFVVRIVRAASDHPALYGVPRATAIGRCDRSTGVEDGTGCGNDPSLSNSNHNHHNDAH